jgi:hypothetical protein
MIHFYFGRSGQTWPCAAQLAERARREGKPVFLLVPQQYTLSAERMLIRHFGAEGFFDLDVLSPARLRQRVFSRAGGSDRVRIDSLGKAMTVARALDREKSNSRTIKALMQVVDITSKVTSKDGQKVVVEVDNDWTERIVDKIIKNKQQLGKVCVVPFRVHRVMGQLLCQFSLMPELNMVYRELFSNKGATIFASQEDRAE